MMRLEKVYFWFSHVSKRLRKPRCAFRDRVGLRERHDEGCLASYTVGYTMEKPLVDSLAVLRLLQILQNANEQSIMPVEAL
jgi:hypothetical protein